MPDIPPQLLVPLGAILAACITSVATFFGLVVSKEQKTSEFRQNWIDSLRSELAEFCGHARRISLEPKVINFKTLAGTAIERIEHQNEEALRPDQFHENRQRMAQMYYSLRLRLNPAEADHQALLAQIDKVYEVLNTHPDMYSGTIAELDAISAVAQGLLKREWTRVKEGEPTFRSSRGVAKNFALISAVTLLIGIGYYVWMIAVAT